MRNLLAFVAAALLVFAGLGWYFDWYKVQRVPTPQGHQGFTIDINRDKISTDVSKGAGKVQEVLEKKNASEGPAAAPQDKVPGGRALTTDVLPRVIISAEEEFNSTAASSKNAP